MKTKFVIFVLGMGLWGIPHLSYAQEKFLSASANSVKISSPSPAAGIVPALPADGNSVGKNDPVAKTKTAGENEKSRTALPSDILQSRVAGELNFRETDIRTVLAMIAEQSGVPIDIPFKSEGAVTLALKDIPLADLLKIVLDPHGMGFVSEGGRVRVLSPSENAAGAGHSSSTHARVVRLLHEDPHRVLKDLAGKMSAEGRVWVDEKNPVLYLLDTAEYLKTAADFLTKNDFSPLKTEIFSLNYAAASWTVDQVKSLLTPDLGTLQSDPAANTLVVTDTAEKVGQVAELLRKIDQKQEVVLNIAVYKIQLNEEHQDGIDWEAIVSRFRRFDILGQKDGFPPEKNRLSLGTLTGEDYEILIEALETVGTVTRLSEEQVFAILNRETAVRLDGSLKAGEPGEKGKAPLAASKPVNPSGFSLSLKVRPSLNDKNTLALDISPKLLWREEGPAHISGAALNNFNPQDRVRVDMADNDVFVMGGLLREKEVKQISKFPLLGDLPLFGFVFRHQNRLIERTEYAVFIVPQLSLDKNSVDKK